MSTPEPITTITIPTLGRPVSLGELYDARTKQFLKGLVLDESVIEGAHEKILIPNTELSIDMANSFESKASVLDIKANLSVDILGGLISVKGSAEYLKDTSSSTQNRSWALGLKGRFREERFVFTDESVKKHTVDLGEGLGAATTHFVSAIQYGGDALVTLTERRAENSEEESIKGNLQAAVKGLAGLVDVSGEAAVDITGKFEGVNEMCQIKVHIDAKIQKVPTNAQEVLNFFKDSAKLIGDGVPMFVTLTPISVLDTDISVKLRELEETILQNLLNAFGRLEDVKSRFSVLLEAVKPSKAYVPSLTRTIETSFGKFTVEHSDIVSRLKVFLEQLHSDDADLDDSQEIIKVVTDLLEKHDTPSGPDDPSSLRTLEDTWTIFQDLVSVTQYRKVKLNNVEEVQQAALTDDPMALFLVSSPLSIDLISRFSLFIHNGLIQVKQDHPGIHSYFLFVESSKLLEQLPNHGDMGKVEGTVLFLSKTKGQTLVWNRSEVPDYFEFTKGSSPDLLWNQMQLPGFNVNRALTFVISGHCYKTPSAAEHLAGAGFWHHQLLTVREFRSRVEITAHRNLTAAIFHGGGSVELSSPEGTIASGKTFRVAFVFTGAKILLYLNGELVQEKEYKYELSGYYYDPVLLAAFESSTFGVDYVRLYPRALAKAELGTLPTR